MKYYRSPCGVRLGVTASCAAACATAAAPAGTPGHSHDCHLAHCACIYVLKRGSCRRYEATFSQRHCIMTSSSDEEDDIFKWDMQDDRQFVLRPGYKFPNPMTYKQMCERVNFEVQKVGSDPVRPKIRKRVDIRGELVPPVVSFYCCHRRTHPKRDKPAKTGNEYRPKRITTTITPALSAWSSAHHRHRSTRETTTVRLVFSF